MKKTKTNWPKVCKFTNINVKNGRWGRGRDWWWIRRSQRSQARRCLVLPLSTIYARFALIADAGGDATLANPKGVFRAHSVETRALCVVARRRVVVGIHRLAGAVRRGAAALELVKGGGAARAGDAGVPFTRHGITACAVALILDGL